MVDAQARADDFMDFRKRAMPSGAPGGYGTITPKGYRRITVDGRQRMEHVLVWERANGAIPEGFQTHHKNENKLDNRLENLELVDALTHKRIHSGCYLVDGQWIKPCRECGKHKPVDQFYPRRDGITAACKSCSIGRSIRDKRARKKRISSNS